METKQQKIDRLKKEIANSLRKQHEINKKFGIEFDIQKHLSDMLGSLKKEKSNKT